MTEADTGRLYDGDEAEFADEIWDLAVEFTAVGQKDEKIVDGIKM